MRVATVFESSGTLEGRAVRQKMGLKSLERRVDTQKRGLELLKGVWAGEK